MRFLCARHPHSPPTRQTPDSKKEEFRKYLEKNGVIDAFTKGWLVQLALARHGTD